MRYLAIHTSGYGGDGIARPVFEVEAGEKVGISHCSFSESSMVPAQELQNLLGPRVTGCSRALGRTSRVPRRHRFASGFVA